MREWFGDALVTQVSILRSFAAFSFDPVSGGKLAYPSGQHTVGFRASCSVREVTIDLVIDRHTVGFDLRVRLYTVLPSVTYEISDLVGFRPVRRRG